MRYTARHLHAIMKNVEKLLDEKLVDIYWNGEHHIYYENGSFGNRTEKPLEELFINGTTKECCLMLSSLATGIRLERLRNEKKN